MTWLFSIVAIAVALILAAAVYTLLASRRIARRYPPTGRLIDIGGRRVHLVDLPAQAEEGDAGPALVFIHGASGNLHEQRQAFGEAFSTRHRRIFIDRPGQGWTERKGRSDSAPLVQAEVIADALTALGVARAIVVGHSWGGAVAAAFGVGFPERTAGLVFLSAATHPREGGIHGYYSLAAHPFWGRLFTRTLTLPLGRLLFSPTIRSVFAPNVPPQGYAGKGHLPLVLRPESFRANAEDVADLLGHVTELAPRYGEISVPVEVVTGDSDAVVYAHIHSAGLARDIEGARLTTLPGVGHMPHHVRTDAIAEVIGRVIGRVEARAHKTKTPDGEDPTSVSV